MRESRAGPHAFSHPICSTVTDLGLKARDVSLVIRSAEVGIKQEREVRISVCFFSSVANSPIQAHFLFHLLSIRKQILNSVVIMGQDRMPETRGRAKGWPLALKSKS